MLKRLWFCMKRNGESTWWFPVFAIVTALGLFTGGAGIIAHFVNRPGETPREAYFFVTVFGAILLAWAVIVGRHAFAIRRFWLQFGELAPITQDDLNYVGKHVVVQRVRHAAEVLEVLYTKQKGLRKDIVSADLSRAKTARDQLQGLERQIPEQKRYFYDMLDAANSRFLPLSFRLRRDYQTWLL